MIYKNSEPNAFSKNSQYTNSKVLLNRYNGKLNNAVSSVLSNDNGTRFEAQVIINGDKTVTNSKFRVPRKANNSVVI